MKNILITGIILLSGLHLFAQNDTIWLNTYLEKTTEDNAKYYRILTENMDGTFDVKEYYKSGEMFLEGTTTSREARNFEGKVLNYAKDGFMFYEVEYENQTPKTINSYLPNGESFFYEFYNRQDGLGMVAYYSGKNDMASIAEYQNKENYVFKNYRFDDKLNKILLTHQVYEKSALVKTISYDLDGKFVGECSYHSYLPYEGILLDYYLEGVKLKSKTEYSNGKIISSENYFPSGKLKKTIKTEGNTETSVYYDKTGKEIGTFTSEETNTYYSKNKNGIQVEYDYREGKEDNISSIVEYENGTLKKETLYDYDDGSKYSIMYYKSDFILEKKEDYHNEKLVNTSIYDEYGKIIDGIDDYDKNIKNVYKDGKLISGLKTYSNGKTFSERKGTEEVFYDQNGKEMGRIIYYNDDIYASPYSGKFYQIYNDQIVESSVYKDGKMIESIFWDYAYSEPYNLYKKTINAYPTSYGGVDISEEIHYYKNGKISSHITYEGYYLKVKGEFYDEKGKLLGTMDYRTSSGTEYTFFESGNIRAITTYKNGEITYEKIFTRDYSYETYSYEYKLVKEIDYNKEGVFYFKDDVFRVEYKDGKPYNGQVLHMTNYSSSYTLTPYKNGEINGEVITYDSYNNELVKTESYSNGKRIGKIKEYSYGNILSVEKEVNERGNIHGKYREYSEDGKLVRELIYEDGKIISGYAMTTVYGSFNSDLYTKTVYEKGEIQEITNVRNGKIRFKSVQVFPNKYNEEHYDENGNKRLVCQVNNGYLDGTVRYFSEKGKELHKAEFSNGRFVSGEVLFKNTSQYDEIQPEYLKCTKTKNGYKISGYDSEGKEMYKITETLKNQQDQSILLQKMLRLDVFSNDLYGSLNDYYYGLSKNESTDALLEYPTIKD